MINLEWIQRLEAARFLLTKREMDIVNYLEERFDLLQQISVDDLVNATNTSRPTVHRFCKKLGYAGFKNFKNAMNQFNQSIKFPERTLQPHELTPNLASKAATDGVQSAFELFQKGFAVDIEALQQTARLFSEVQIMRIAEMLLNAQTCYCVGYETGSFPAQFMAERLSRLCQKVQIAIGDQRLIKDLLFSISDADVLFIFEYHKNFGFHKVLGEFAQKRGAKIVLMTGYSISLTVTLADETLIVHRGMAPFKHSMAVPMTVVNNLLLAVEFMLGDKRQTYLEEWDRLYEK